MNKEYYKEQNLMRTIAFSQFQSQREEGRSDSPSTKHETHVFQFSRYTQLYFIFYFFLDLMFLIQCLSSNGFCNLNFTSVLVTLKSN